MTGILASMAAGFGAGAAGAYGQAMDDNIKAKREAEKEAVLEARMKNMLKLQQEFQTSERKASENRQDVHIAKQEAQDRNLSSYLAGDKSIGGEGYEVLMTPADWKRGMDAKGILAVTGIEKAEKNRVEDLSYKKSRDIEEDKIKREQIHADKGNDFHYEVGPDGNVSVYDKGKLISGSGKGKLPRDPDADPKENSFKYKEAKLKHVETSVKDFMGSDIEKRNEQERVGAEFDAKMLNWQKKTIKETGQPVYVTDKGVLIDVYGNIIKEKIEETEAPVKKETPAPANKPEEPKPQPTQYEKPSMKKSGGSTWDRLSPGIDKIKEALKNSKGILSGPDPDEVLRNRKY